MLAFTYTALIVFIFIYITEGIFLNNTPFEFCAAFSIDSCNIRVILKYYLFTNVCSYLYVFSIIICGCLYFCIYIFLAIRPLAVSAFCKLLFSLAANLKCSNLRVSSN